MSRRLVMLALVLLAAGLLADPAWAQCPMCRRALESPEAARLADAFRSGVLVLFAAPFVVFGTIAVWAVRTLRRHEDATASKGV